MSLSSILSLVAVTDIDSNSLYIWKSKFIGKMATLPRVYKNRDHHGKVNSCKIFRIHALITQAGFLKDPSGDWGLFADKNQRAILSISIFNSILTYSKKKQKKNKLCQILLILLIPRGRHLKWLSFGPIYIIMRLDACVSKRRPRVSRSGKGSF